MTKEHKNHVPDHKSEIRTIPLPAEAIKIIEQQLRSGSSCRNTRISTLHQIESWVWALESQIMKRGTLCSIYEKIQMKALLYIFVSNKKDSLAVWINVKLSVNNYCIFTATLSPLNDNKDLFAFGFQSPLQVGIMRNLCKKFLDHVLSCNSPLCNQKGFPVAYMITNDKSAVPIIQWLSHLLHNSRFRPLHITINCYISEHCKSNPESRMG
ncbi:hypothetical protein PHYBLDRAFT_70975 [Phycomyces blakesleeanus NRRL 1555(-)]|uniref:MULE transposase domain-containing protein n=1 Tax=Phycomyces blakesleeanus (strain ATCC 8743b / DSM 1359 / FGSC 10004 / NBRC 33097 / NRRL 1555) TaxID=763407 RepID=A0A163CWW0_PHYB8|nr:hypothetical protein PHYBLDRAFT_70975 [Phycomyces blakesleeanus NRRL 1555(-)]OAD66190.1 hypothetical protein PHYBLDRAFT_70975 [Phycomyces blakesleeanus NRRL 1555(-)]|eukprot:XP_018284230.1 hypothetical protein PHYBLDRAFT_70975 [Phycomyces blakesleeanus NRRL 1555(-)]